MARRKHAVKVPKASTVTWALRYGTATLIGYERGGGGSVYRIESYAPYDGGRIERDRIAAVSTDDVSVRASGYHGTPLPGDTVRYNPRCSACYLGHGHTVAYHERAAGTVTHAPEGR